MISQSLRFPSNGKTRSTEDESREFPKSNSPYRVVFLLFHVFISNIFNVSLSESNTSYVLLDVSALSKLPLSLKRAILICVTKSLFYYHKVETRSNSEFSVRYAFYRLLILNKSDLFLI